jgi:mitochondrial fission process protein 1
MADDSKSAPTPAQTAKPTVAAADPKSEGHGEEASTAETMFRYLGYGGRLKTVALSASRYLAFTSDLGEAFRPIINPRLVTASYGISWLYCATDVALYGYKDWAAGASGSHISRTVTERSIFQSVASMGLPALTIHTTVRVFASVFKKLGRYQKWGPTAMGLAVVPFLPVFDHPVEHSLDWLFTRYWPLEGGEAAHKKSEEKRE